MGELFSLKDLIWVDDPNKTSWSESYTILGKWVIHRSHKVWIPYLDGEEKYIEGGYPETLEAAKAEIQRRVFKAISKHLEKA